MKNILIVYDQFVPAWKAGGPIRSIEQLINHLSSEYTFYVLCSAYDLGENYVIENIITDKWTEWNGKAKVYYNTRSKSSLSFFVRQFDEIKPDIIFINGLYSLYYNIKPLITGLKFKNKNKHTKLILSPRGMLHTGALSQKKMKKKFFFFFFKLLNIHSKVLWHATDEKEAHFIRSKFKNARIVIAGNFPNLSVQLPTPVKEKGKLIMGTVALISPMKNILEIIKALQSITNEIIWYVYGPVKDVFYWDICLKAINELPSNIQVVYMGAIPPDKILSALEKTHFFILPSKSENFGHSIFEALSAGKPVITTNTTPFTDLNQKKAGATISINHLQSQLIQTISEFAEMDQETYLQYQFNAIEYANSFINIDKLKDQYRYIFSNTHQ